MTEHDGRMSNEDKERLAEYLRLQESSSPDTSERDGSFDDSDLPSLDELSPEKRELLQVSAAFMMNFYHPERVLLKGDEEMERAATDMMRYYGVFRNRAAVQEGISVGERHPDWTLSEVYLAARLTARYYDEEVQGVTPDTDTQRQLKTMHTHFSVLAQISATAVEFDQRQRSNGAGGL